jgi:lipopolysaccharide export system protein LptA
MKAIFFASVILGVAVLGGAQTAPEKADVRADTVVRNAGTLHLHGNVQITVGSVRVTADDADVAEHPGNAGIELNGHVHFTSTGPMGVVAGPRPNIKPIDSRQ